MYIRSNRPILTISFLIALHALALTAPSRARGDGGMTETELASGVLEGADAGGPPIGGADPGDETGGGGAQPPFCPLGADTTGEAELVEVSAGGPGRVEEPSSTGWSQPESLAEPGASFEGELAALEDHPEEDPSLDPATADEAGSESVTDPVVETLDPDPDPGTEAEGEPVDPGPLGQAMVAAIPEKEAGLEEPVNSDLGFGLGLPESAADGDPIPGVIGAGGKIPGANPNPVTNPTDIDPTKPARVLQQVAPAAVKPILDATEPTPAGTAEFQFRSTRGTGLLAGDLEHKLNIEGRDFWVKGPEVGKGKTVSYYRVQLAPGKNVWEARSGNEVWHLQGGANTIISWWSSTRWIKQN